MPGISWVTIHNIDHTEDWRESHRHYVPLPDGARTEGTRVRWWQPLSDAKEEPIAWALDNVYIGTADFRILPEWASPRTDMEYHFLLDFGN